MRDYWVMVKDGPVPEIELVRDGFSWGAFLIPIVWVLYRRLWRIAACLVLLLGVLPLVLQEAGLNPTGIGLVNLAETLALGWFGNDFRRWELARKGYRAVDVVEARRLDDAEVRAIARLAERDDAHVAENSCPKGLHARPVRSI
jgi:hypothetical protein